MKLKKRMIIIGMTVILCILLNLNKVEAAALQINEGTPAIRNVNEWIIEIRKMQEAGGALGLTDTINYDESNPESSDLTSGNKSLDIHMEKNTEYGAMAILSASSYGNPNKINDGDTTTGNKTGVVIRISESTGERVSAGIENIAAQAMKNASGRYKNIYEYDYASKAGDAIIQGSTNIGTWHTTNPTTNWLSYNQFYPETATLVRAFGTNIFGYNGTTGGWNSFGSWDGIGCWHQKVASRAVVVTSSGI